MKTETENGYTTTAFSDDIPGTVGPFKFELGRNDIINNFNEIIPFIVRSSIRFRSVLKYSETPEDTLNKVIQIGRSIFSSLNPEIREIITSSRSLHIFTDDLVLPWTLLHDGIDFVSLKHPIGISSSKKRLHNDKSEVSGKLRLLFIVDSKEDLPQSGIDYVPPDKENAVQELVEEGISADAKIRFYNVKYDNEKIDLNKEYIDKIKKIPQKNLKVELAYKLLDDAIKAKFKRNIVKQKSPHGTYPDLFPSVWSIYYVLRRMII